MNKKPEVTDATRNTFVVAFCELYREKPIEKISVKEVIARAGYSRATFYNYFQDVYDLREYAENAFIDSIMARVVENIRSGRQMDDFVLTFMNILQENTFYIDVFIGSANSSHFVEKIYKRTTPLLRDAFGLSDDNMSAAYVLKFYIAGLIPTLGMWLQSDRFLTEEDLALLIKGILRDGIIKQLNSY